jgi:hypothetical protein
VTARLALIGLVVIAWLATTVALAVAHVRF